MEDTPTSAFVFQELGRMGVRVEIDDFGTGYSSLGYLHRLPVEAVKIDRSLVHRLATGDERPEIVASIVRLARTLGIEATAEGIETAEQLEQLRGLGCELGQGSYFAPPLIAAEAAALLELGPKA